MRFYDLHTRADDVDNLKNLVLMAERLGWSGIGVIMPYSTNWKENLEKLKKVDSGLDVVFGLEIKPKKPSDIKTVYKVRKSVELVFVSGGDSDINRKAVEIPEVDILTNHSGMLDHISVKLAKKNNVAIEFDFNGILHSYKQTRIGLLEGLLKIAKLARKFRAPFIITSKALSSWDLRSPSDLISFGRILGFQDPEIRTSLSDKIAKENRKRISKSWVMPGVELE